MVPYFHPNCVRPGSSLNTDLVSVTPRGLYCGAGDFYIDPWLPVPTALITHTHSDHARLGSNRYLTAADNASLLRKRLGPTANIESVAYGEQVRRIGVVLSFHAAGLILGSSQIRIESDRLVWVVSGDYERDADATCAPFEPLRCDTFISEATFALPIYHWDVTSQVIADICQWWQSNRTAGLSSVLFCYALGKAQRVLAELRAFTHETVLLHGAVETLVRAACGLAHRSRGLLRGLAGAAAARHRASDTRRCRMKSVAALADAVRGQAVMLAYERIFLVFGATVLLAIPLILTLKWDPTKIRGGSYPLGPTDTRIASAGILSAGGVTGVGGATLMTNGMVSTFPAI